MGGKSKAKKGKSKAGNASPNPTGGNSKSDKAAVNPVEGEGNAGPISHDATLSGEVSLVKYMEDHPVKVIAEAIPGQSETHSAPEEGQLDDRTRALMFNSIDMLDDLVNVGICIEELKVSNIVINMSSGRPRFVGIVLLERKRMSRKEFEEHVGSNYSELAKIFSRHVLDRVAVKPAAVTHLLYLMENHACAMRLLINYHQATVPLANYTTLYLRVHNYTWDILRIKDPDGFSYVMKSLEFDQHWRQPLVHNEHMLKYYNHKPSYGNSLPPGTDAYLRKEQYLVSRFHRNAPSHPLDYGLDSDPSSSSGMLYSPCVGLGLMYVTHLPRFTYSLQAGLHAINKLRFVELKSLFSNSLKEHRPIR